MKRLLSFALVFCMLFVLMPVTAFAETDPLTYTLSTDGTYYIVSGCDDVVEVVISSEHNGIPVKEIGESAFLNLHLKSVVIPDSIISIGAYAFECCSLKSVSFPDSIITISEYAFSSCRYIESIEIPSSVKSIGKRAFDGCKKLTTVSLAEGITTIGEFAFSDCESITGIVIPDSVIDIGYGIFSGCDMLESIAVGDANKVYHDDKNCLIETAAKKLLSGCKSSIIPSDGSVTSIGDYAFANCDGLTNVEIPSSVTRIGVQSFLSCDLLENIVIPDSVKTIAEGAFNYCGSIKSFEIPSSVDFIGKYALSGCFSLESITVDDENPVYHDDGNCLIETKTKTLIVGCKNSIIPSDFSVTSIGDYAFSFCKMTNIDIPNSITEIGVASFEFCENLTSIVIPDSVIKIWDAFVGCSALTCVVIPDSVISIEAYAFTSCHNLTDIYCEAESKPEGWSSNWCIYCNNPTIHWGFKGVLIEEVEEGAIPEGSEKYIEKSEDTTDALREKLNAEIVDIYDIILIKDGEPVQPNGMVSVSIQPSGVVDVESVKVYYIAEDGTLVDTYADYENGFFVFYTDYLSVYVVAGKAAKVPVFDDTSSDDTTSDDNTDTPEEEIVLGDIDGNGEVEADDYILLKRVYFGMAKNVDLSVCDVNNDGEVNADDYILLKRVYFGMAKLG